MVCGMRAATSLWLLWLLGFPAGAISDEGDGPRLPERSWQELEGHRGAVSGPFFVEAMERIYAPTADWERWMQVEKDGVWIEMGPTPGGERMFIGFAESEATGADSLSPEIEGLRIVLDPGHIGGAWGPMEERSFSVGEGPLLQEGDLNLAVAERLAGRGARARRGTRCSDPGAQLPGA